jgi:hypothetical protein
MRGLTGANGLANETAVLGSKSHTAYSGLGSIPAGRDSRRVFHIGKMLCWAKRPSSAKSGR